AVIIPMGDAEHAISTHSDTDVESLWWDQQGSKLYFTTSRQAKSAELRIAEEGESGWLYDGRMAPNDGVAPRLQVEDAVPTTFSLDPRSGAVQAANKVQVSPAS